MFKKINNIIEDLMQNCWEEEYMYDNKIEDNVIIDILIEELKGLKDD